MIIRKLVKAGQASHTISLPKDWLEKNNLNKGDIIYIRELSDKELLISTETKTEESALKREITISTSSEH